MPVSEPKSAGKILPSTLLILRITLELGLQINPQVYF
jgi:hypothetical protein